MRDCNYFDFGRRLTKHNNVGKPPEYFSTSVESERRELIRTLLNTLQSGAKFDYTGSKPTAQPIPFNGCFAFEQRLRVNPDRFHLEGTLAQRRRSVSSQESMATAPLFGDCDLKRVPKRAEAAAPGFRWPLPSSQPHAPGAPQHGSVSLA